MAKGNRDVELVIRAKNQASKALDAVSTALGELQKSQATVVTGSQKTSSVLTQLGSSFAKLNGQIGGTSAMGKVAGEMDKATGAVSQLQKSLTDLVAEQGRVAAAIEKSGRAVTNLSTSAAKLNGTLSKQKSSTETAKAAFASLTGEVSRTEKGIAKGQASLSTLGAKMAATGPQLDQARAAYRSLAAQILSTKKPSDALQEAFRNARSEVVRQTGAFDRARASYAKTGSSVSQLQASLAGLKAEQASAAAAFATATSAQEKTASSLGRVDARLKETRANLSGLQVSAEQGAAGVIKLSGQLNKAQADLRTMAPLVDQTSAKLKMMGAGGEWPLERAIRTSRRSLGELQSTARAAAIEMAKLSAAGGSRMKPDAGMAQQIELFKRARAAAREEELAINQLGVAYRALKMDVATAGPAMQAAVTQMQRAEAAARQLAAAQRQLGVTGASAAAGQHRMAGSARAAAAAMAAQANEGRAAMTWMQRLRGEVIALALAYGGLYAAISQLKEANAVYQTIEASQSRLMVGFGSAEAVAKEMRWIRSEAKRLGIELGTLASEYSKMAIATKGTNMEGEETRRIFTAVSEAARVSKLSTENIKGTYLALTQMVSKGAVSMEELRRQLGDRLPGAFTIAARAMNMTGGELDKLISSGGLATDVFLPKFARELEKTFSPQLANALESMAADMGRFDMTKFNARETFNKGGWIEGFRAALRELTAYMESEEGQSFFYNLGKAAGSFVQVLAKIPAYSKQIALAFSLIAGLKLFHGLSAAATMLSTRFVAATSGAARTGAALSATGAAANRASGALTGLGGVTGVVGARMAVLSRWVRISTVNMNAAQVAAWGLSRAMGVLRGAMAALGGLPGLIIAGLSVAFASWLTSSNDVIDATDEHQRQMMQVIDAYEKAKNGAGDWAKELNGLSLADAEKNLSDLMSQLKRQTKALDGSLAINSGTDEFRADIAAFRKLRDQMRWGKINAEELRVAFDKMLGDSTVGEDIKEHIRKSADLARQAGTTSQAIANQALVVEGMGGSVANVSPVVRALGSDMDALAGSLGNSTFRVNEAKEAYVALGATIQGLRGKIPSLVEEMQLEKALSDIDELVDKAREAAKEAQGSQGEGTAMAQLRKAEALAAQARREVQDAYQDKKNAPGIKAAEAAAKAAAAAAKSAAADDLRRRERAEGYNTELDRTLARKLQELQLGKDISLEQAQIWAIADERLRAENAGVVLTEQRLAQIKEIARIEWDAAAAIEAKRIATEQLAEAEQQINRLQQHRRDLMASMVLANDTGNLETYVVLKEQLLGVENQLRAAIDAQIAFWEAAAGGPDGEKAAAALANLQNLKMSLQEVEARTWPTVRAMGTVFGQELSKGADNFLDKIRETGDVIGSLKEAFLQFASDFLLQIAKMILQQMLFNALSAASGGGGFMGAAASAIGAGVQHTGGIAGSSGNATRSVSPAWFRNARRYHTGGIAGLKANEVPSILEKGEEVLTANDPRHANNGGGTAPSQSVKIVNAIDAGSFVSAGVEDVAGQKAILNFIRANQSAVRGAIGV